MDSEPELNALPLPPLLALPEPQANGTARPWNLRQRTRRCPAASISWAAAVPVPSSYRRRKRAPFLVALTPEEIEEDIYVPTSPSLPLAPPSSPSHRRPLPPVSATVLPKSPPSPSLPSAPLSSLLLCARLRHGGSASGAEADGEGDGGRYCEFSSS
uniref:Uncharacterized protein n=1 Tax=Oryza barthii TaxID=65489 RepID=A0A0D3HN45_9ORYZ